MGRPQESSTLHNDHAGSGAHPPPYSVGNVVLSRGQNGRGLKLTTEIDTHHVTRHNTPIHNTLSTVPQLSISQKDLGTLPEDGNVMPKHVGATIHN
jgi:hypothetical protein